MEDDQQFCLRWNNHQSTLISVFDTLLEKGIHVDCTLAAEGRTLRAHKVVLSACSPYFEAVLGQQYDKHPIIILKDVKFAELRAMMDYMYRGEVNISQDQLGALLKAAESLQIKGLSDNKPSATPPNASPSPKTPAARASPRVDPEQRSRDGSVSPRRKRRKHRSSLSPVADPSSDGAPPQLNSRFDANSDEAQSKIKNSEAPDPPPTAKAEAQIDVDPKPEYPEDGNEDSVEDLTMDEEANSDGEQGGCSSGPGGDANAQGFPWQFERSQEETAAGPDGQRDIQGSTALEMAPILSQLRKISATGIPAALCSETDSALLAAANANLMQDALIQNNNIITKEEAECKTKCEIESEGENYDFDDILLPDESEVFGSAYLGSGGEDESTVSVTRMGGRRGINSDPIPQFECRHCGKRYRWKSTLRRHESVECGGKPPAHACPYCPYRAKQRAEDVNFTLIGGLSWEQWSARLAHPVTTSLRESNSPTLAGGGFACPDCGRVYKLKSSLRNHQKWECGKEPQFQCPHCVYRAKQKMHIARHMERMHREKVYVKPEPALHTDNLDACT